jgi:hypothetical protein
MNDAPRMIAQELAMNDTDLDAALMARNDCAADLSTLSTIILGLRKNADRLAAPLTTILHETRDAINRTLSVLENRPCPPQ